MKKTTPGTESERTALSSPEAIQVLTLLKAKGWLHADVPAVKQFFADDRENAARAVLMSVALTGGQSGYLQLAFLLGFAAMALLLTSFQPVMSPVVFTLWAALGVAAALTLRKHPGLLGFCRKAK